ncbi:UDP-N-acetylmuramate dehydrogenase [Desulfovibrio inopinatus]|uniref:UDP-N-acetylmuramate dehydrogenase n=1 Tax=Desulfovibrio inopinatus TaxID=102109 RepID=UPI0004027394|nr:UDP-N-acetylmuramate dehydrogenase [Desulfovibrio inopinatus]
MDKDAILTDLQKFLAPSSILVDAPLARFCTWKIGGPADILVSPASVEEVAQVKHYAHQNALPMVVIGSGSNILFDDAGFRGIIMRIGESLSEFSIDTNGFVRVGAGIWTPGYVRRVASAGFAGCTHAIGIPGSLGGLIVMNGGMYRKRIGEQLVEATVVHHDGTIGTLSHQDCAFGYRSSRLQHEDIILVGATFQYTHGKTTTLRREMLNTLRERNRKFPRKLPNCGSVFLSEPTLYETVGPPGKAIEETGLKGERCGGAVISPQHANFIVNTGGATSADILRLISKIRAAVYARTGHKLGCEVRHLPPTGTMQPAHISADQYFLHV